MNPETKSLCEACIECLALDATNEQQQKLQATCCEILNSIAGWEMILDQDPVDYPAIEA